MTWTDLLGGLALAGFFAPLFGMVASLFMSLNDSHESRSYSSSIITPRDLRRIATTAAVFLVVFTVPSALLFKSDREDAESWQSYIRDHRCVVVEQRTRTECQFNPGLKMNQCLPVTEYLWRCDGGDEHWKR